MRAFPSIVTPAAAAATMLLTALWWDRGTYSALSLGTGYVAAALLLVTLAVTPVYRLRRGRRAPIHLPVRRSLGVHAGLLAVVHMLVSFPVHLGGDVLRYFFHPDGGLLLDRFGTSNWLGLATVALVLVLLGTSTDSSIRQLGARRWKMLHQLVFAVAVLTVLHTLGYQDLRGAWTGLTIAVLAATASLAAFRLLSRLGLRRARTRS